MSFHVDRGDQQTCNQRPEKTTDVWGVCHLACAQHGLAIVISYIKSPYAHRLTCVEQTLVGDMTQRRACHTADVGQTPVAPHLKSPELADMTVRR